MTVEEKIQAVLEGSGSVTSVVPVARIKVPGDWQDLALPYIIHFPLLDEPIHTHDGLAKLRIWRFYQVWIYAASYSQAAQLRDAVILALDGFCDADVNRIAYARTDSGSGTRATGNAGEYDTDRKLQEIGLTFEVTEGTSLGA